MEPVSGNSWIEAGRTLLRRGEVNRAVAYLIASRGWQFCSGLLTVVLLTKFLPAGGIGVYYAFASQLGVQSFFDLGLPGIVAILASHEWTHLELSDSGQMQGNARSLSRLAWLQRFADRWFLVASVLFVVVAGGLGTWNLAASQTGGVDWRWPWICSVLTSAICLPYIPRIAILEGCNQVDRVNLMRLVQSVAGSLVVWVCLLSDLGLWALVGSNMIRWGCETWLVRIRYGAMFRSLSDTIVDQPMNWRQEIWPLQWRQAIQSVGIYFSTDFFQPLILRFHGGVAAGRFGLTWQVLKTLHSISFSWINTRMAELGVLASRGEHDFLRQRLRKTGLIGLGVFVTGAVGYGLVVEGLRAAGIKLANHFLPPSEATLLAVGLAGVLIATVRQTGERLYKREPFLIPNLVTAIFMAALAWEAGRRSGSFGLAACYAGLTWGFTVPVTLWLTRRTAMIASLPAQQIQTPS